MESIFKNFLRDHQECTELLGEFKFQRDDENFDILLDRFNDYLFKMYAVSYIKKTIKNDAKQIKKRITKQIKRNNEELTLNNTSDEFSESNIDNLEGDSVDFVESISAKSKSFKEIITDEELLESIESLSKKQREILFLEFLKGLDEKTIAKQKKVSVQSINKTKLRALNHLKADWRCKHGKCC